MSLKLPPFHNKICKVPFEYIDIQNPKNNAVNCYACCPTLVPEAVGDLKVSSLEEIWQGDVYKKLRKSIFDGSYEFCNVDLCPEIQTNNLYDISSIKVQAIAKVKKEGLDTFKLKPKIINLSYDRSCNLACPSCRDTFITSNSLEDDLVCQKITDEILSRDLSFTTLIACSSGDPFVSGHFKRLLYTLNGDHHPGLDIQIMSNGLLFNRHAWESMHKIHKNIGKVCISLDAATAKTYAVTRKGGNWDLLMKNLEFLSMLRTRNEISFLRLDFVVQDHNYLEMVDFVSLGRRFNADEVFFQKVVNWGFFTEEEFKQRAIYLPNHLSHADFLKVINSPVLNLKFVNKGNLGHFFSQNNKYNNFNLKNAILHSYLRLKREGIVLFCKNRFYKFLNKSY